MITEVTAVILAGGKSSRFGSDKAFTKIEGSTFIRKQIKILKKIFKKIIVVTNSPGRYKLKNIPVLRDIIPGLGPLSGIHAGLCASHSFHNFVLACDMPFINEALIRYIIKSSGNYDVIIPKVSGKPHPLFGVYSKNCIPVIEEMMRCGRLKISGIFPRLKAHFISKREIQKFDKKSLSLLNINTKADLSRAKELFLSGYKFPR